MSRLNFNSLFIPKVIESQILAIRDSKEINIHQTRNVIALARRKGFDDLADWLPEHQNEYWMYIINTPAGL